MNEMFKETNINTLVILLALVLVVIIVLGAVVLVIKIKEKSQIKAETRGRTTKETGKTTANYEQSKQSIFNFMEFDDIEDNMIAQKNGNRYLMVIGCQGVNYDLMSGVEKSGVEEGFVQFLNTLRHPIQIYVQTRAINLESSLQVYREKIQQVENKYRNMELRYQQMVESGNYTDEQMQKAYFELTKQANLREYGNSVIQDTERMSLNKNILNKTYYIIVPYYSAEAGNDKLDKQEIKNIAFSELYTRCQSIISSISPCGVRGKILRTNELIELLYMAYNRDEAETFGLDKALKAGFNSLYSTAPDIYEKKMEELNKIIEKKAVEKAQQKIEEAKTEMQEKVEETEKNIDEIISQMAKLILEENEQYIGSEVKNIAMQKLEETNEGGNTDGKKKRGRRKKATTE